MDKSIQTSGISQKSAKVSLMAVSAALIFAAVCMIFFQYLSLRNALVKDLTVQAQIIAENSGAAIVFGDGNASEETLDSLSASPSVIAAAIFNLKNVPLAYYSRHGGYAIEAPTSHLLENTYVFHGRFVDMAQVVYSGNDAVGHVVLRADLYEMYQRLAVSILITMLIIVVSLGVAYLLVSRMRGALAEAESHLNHLAHTDFVTGLPNRHSFSERLNFAISKVKRFGGSVELLLLDLDNFKYVNDTLGHHSGDQLLKLVAQRLAGALREADTICRIGGDEFAIIIESGDAARTGVAVANKVIYALSLPFMLGQNEVYVTSSIGISNYPGNAQDLPTLTRNADASMYQAKDLGKNTYAVYTPEMDRSVQNRIKLERKLRKALENNELELHYQPKMRLEDETIIGFEALLRWNDPEIGSISPTEFIPVAEESGLMLPIGSWVIRTACRDIAAWRELGLGNVNVAVNLSVRQTKDPNLLDEITGALKQHKIKPAQLELEITESILMEHIESNIALLEKIRACGIRLSIDDFGTGYSSLAYLKRFQIDELKIDRAFIKDIPGDGEDETIVTAIVTLAHSLGLSTVAEGVETREQLDFLRFVQCDSVQGFYISKSVPFKQVAVLLGGSGATATDGKGGPADASMDGSTDGAIKAGTNGVAF